MPGAGLAMQPDRGGKKMKTVVITGATSGIGLEVARLLAGRGFSVIATGCTAQRCESARDSILASAPGAQVRFYAADLMRRREVLELSARIRRALDGGDFAASSTMQAVPETGMPPRKTASSSSSHSTTLPALCSPMSCLRRSFGRAGGSS